MPTPKEEKKGPASRIQEGLHPRHLSIKREGPGARNRENGQKVKRRRGKEIRVGLKAPQR